MNHVPAECHRATTDEYRALVDRATDDLIAVARTAPFDAPLPSCPGWSVATVVEHVGGLHRWAEAHVRLLSPRRLRAAEIDDRHMPPNGSWERWLREGVERLEATLGSADPDRPVWAWGADKHVRFWGRRMLYETTIHRVDVELAVGRAAQIDIPVAVDGVDEFLDNLPHAEYFAPKVKELRGNGERLTFVAPDAGVSWAIQLHADGFSWSHVTAAADVSLTADAGNLLLFMYGRLAPDASGIDIEGDPALLRRWRSNSAL